MESENRARSAAVLAVIAALASGGTTAQEQGGYPAKSVEVIVDWAAGGSVDTMVRGMAQAMAASLGQAFLVVNRDGAAGTIGKGVLAKARADGYTLGFGPINPITNSAQIIEALASDDGREIALELDRLREEGVLIRLENSGEWALRKNAEDSSTSQPAAAPV